MSDRRPNQKISAFLRSRIDAGDFPSAVYLIAEKGEIVFHDAMGFAVVEPEKIRARVDTIYDLASLTKVLVTGLICAKLTESGEICRKQSVGNYLPKRSAAGASGHWSEQVLVEALLTHTSRLPAWKPFYLLVKDRTEILSEILKTPLNFDGPSVTYSDLNFILLTFLLEHIRGETLDEIAKREIFQPLELAATSFNPGPGLRDRIAASEKGNDFERQMSIEAGYSLDGAAEKGAFRENVVWGHVHDGNAYFMKGVSGHAGLFSTAEEVFKIAEQFLPTFTTLLNPETCELFRNNLTPGMNEDRSFAFQLASTADSTAGSQMSRESIGHNGFTGTCVWIDPVAERVFILLTNRTHNHELPFVNINTVRRRFHDLAFAALDVR